MFLLIFSTDKSRMGEKELSVKYCVTILYRLHSSMITLSYIAESMILR